MVKIKSYNDLRVYKTSIELLEDLYEIAYTIPHLDLRNQLIRSSEAIPALIAEGFAKKRNHKESSRFYEMAMTESDEVGVHLEKAMILSKRFNRIPTKKFSLIKENYTSLSKQLNKLSTTWRNFSDKK